MLADHCTTPHLSNQSTEVGIKIDRRLIAHAYALHAGEVQRGAIEEGRIRERESDA